MAWEAPSSLSGLPPTCYQWIVEARRNLWNGQLLQIRTCILANSLGHHWFRPPHTLWFDPSGTSISAPLWKCWAQRRLYQWEKATAFTHSYSPRCGEAGLSHGVHRVPVRAPAQGQVPFTCPRGTEAPRFLQTLQWLVLSQNPGIIKLSAMLRICFQDWIELIKIIKGSLLADLLTWLNLLPRLKRGFYSPLGSSPSRSSYIWCRAKRKLFCLGAKQEVRGFILIFSTLETSFLCT